MANNLKFVQINLRRSRAATGALSNLMAKYNMDVALIQEPWTVNDKVKGLGMTGTVLNRCPSGRPRSCIVHTSRIKPVLLSQFSGKDITAVILERNNNNSRLSKVVVVSLYMPYDERDPITVLLDLLVDWCARQGASMIIGADANACHVSWGSSVTNDRGVKLMDFINNNGLIWLNEGSTPTFSMSVREEVLDVTMVSMEIRSALSSWRVLDDPSLSDHTFISFVLKVRGIQASRIVSEKKSLNVERFMESLGNKLTDSPRVYGTPDEIDAYMEFITTAIVEAASGPLTRKLKGYHSKLPWWNLNLQQLNEKSKRLRKKARRTKRMSDKRKARTADLKLDREIRKAKKKSWREFCKGLNKMQDIARINKILERVEQNNLGLLKRENGTLTNNIKETLELLISEHFPGAMNDSNEALTMGAASEDVLSSRGARPDWSLASKIISEEKISWAIGTFLPYKTPGPDGILPKYLKVRTIVNLVALGQGDEGKPSNWSRAGYLEKNENNVYTKAWQDRLRYT
ncbi:uncharacterized protein LOC108628216 [Ceratina calcarata]|uniref:Uncharacterized protein LOC108622428 n=1 Tax=Ceratina calcarata TaxID=156304 RepID=A0AAJ7J6R0_9HYME|nr:uncharacterized protein LOC108622428 [Ceratina calcarata]XP_017885477.1 uncharacterized protein LOC108628216 [Ceratina calcarata]